MKNTVARLRSGRGGIRPIGQESLGDAIQETARKAGDGGVKAALQMADRTNPLDQRSRFKELHGFDVPLPGDLSPDRLYWLRLAAQGGSPEAQYRFAKDVANMEVAPLPFQEELLRTYPTPMNELRREAKAWLAAAIQSQSVLDAYLVAEKVFRLGLLDVNKDPVSALSFMIALDKSLGTNKSEAFAQNLRPGDRVVAEGRAVGDLSRLLE